MNLIQKRIFKKKKMQKLTNLMKSAMITTSLKNRVRSASNIIIHFIL